MKQVSAPKGGSGESPAEHQGVVVDVVEGVRVDTAEVERPDQGVFEEQRQGDQHAVRRFLARLRRWPFDERDVANVPMGSLAYDVSGNGLIGQGETQAQDFGRDSASRDGKEPIAPTLEEYGSVDGEQSPQGVEQFLVAVICTESHAQVDHERQELAGLDRHRRHRMKHREAVVELRFLFRRRIPLIPEPRDSWQSGAA